MDAAVDGKTRLSPLTDVAAGLSVRIVRIGGGRAMVRRCLALGLTVGSPVTVQQRRGRGVVVANDGNRVALGGEVADQVWVERVT